MKSPTSILIVFTSSIIIWAITLLINKQKYKDFNLVVITGATANYFNKLKKLIGSVHKYDKASIYVYDFGLTKEQIAEVKTYKNR